MTKDENEEIAIYEKLSPGECLIMSRENDNFLVAINEYGNIKLEYIKILNIEDIRK